MSNETNVELTCASGHKSVHALARVLSHDNAWCHRCGADLKLDPARAKELASEAKAAPEQAGNVAVRRVGAG